MVRLREVLVTIVRPLQLDYYFPIIRCSYYHAGGRAIIIILLFTCNLIIKFIIETILKCQFRLAKTYFLQEKHYIVST